MATNLDLIKKSIKKTKAYRAIAKNINYRSVKDYPTTQNIAVNLAAQVMLTEQYEEKGLPEELVHTAQSQSAKIFLYAAYQVEKQQTPCYWLASSLAESLIATDIPDEWTGLKPFVNQGILLLPKNCIEYSGFGETESVDWLYFEVITFPAELTNDNTPKKPIILWTSSSDRLTVFSGSMDLNDSFSIPTSLLDRDCQIVQQVNNLLLNTMLVLNCKPELLDKPPSESKGVGFGNAGKLPSNFAKNPVWIGRVYSQSREYSKPEGKLVRPAREHYRRGHWARRRHGTREKWQYQWHWIEPTVVNYEGY